MERAKDILYPLITLVLIVAVWGLAIRVFSIPSYLLPSPTAVLSALKRGYIDGLFWKDFLFTMRSTLIGYGLGCVAAFFTAMLFAQIPALERFVYPYLVALQSMPKVALAPLILVWCGFGLASKVVMVALVCFFPMFISTLNGLRQASPALLDLMRASSASSAMIFWRVRLPTAATPIFSGLQIAIVLSLIGAVVAEFVSSTQGLGHLVKAAALASDVDIMFAALVGLAVIGVLASGLIQLLHRRIVFWDQDRGSAAVMAAE